MINNKGNLKIYFLSFCAILAIFILISIISNVLPGEKGRVRKFILKGKRAVESQSLLTCVEMISDDYKDKYSNDKQTLIYLTREIFRYYKELFIQIDKMDVKLDEDKLHASVELEGMIIGLNKKGEKENILEKEHGKLKLKLIKQDKRWQLLEVEDFQTTTLMGKNII